MRLLSLLAVTFLAVGVAWSDDGPVTIKVKKAGPGDIVKATKAESGSNKVTVTVNGMDQVMDESASSKYVFTEEVLEKPAGAKRPTKTKRTYETADFEKAGEKADLGLAGKTVLIEKTGDSYSFTIDGQAVTGPAAEVLAKEFRNKEVSEDDLFPTAPVKVGGTWKIDASKVAKDMASDGLIADADKSSASGKLVKVYDKDGAKYGVLEITMELAVTKVGKGDQEIELKAGSKLKGTLVLDMCIDGSRLSATTKIDIKADLSGAKMGADLKFELTNKNSGSVAEVQKK